jgi:hypothetical protein
MGLFPSKRVQIVNDDGMQAELSGKSLSCIDHHYRKVRDGKSFFVQGYSEKDDTEELIFALTTNSTANVGLHFTVQSNKAMTIEAWEGADITGGDSVTPLNRKRTSSTAATPTVVSTPTINDTGNLILSSKFGASGNFFSPGFGGEGGEQGGLILKKSTSYVFKFIANDDACIIDYDGYWYEG